MADLFLNSLAIAFLILICLQSFCFAKKQRRRLPLPPGPKGLPIIGNVLDIPFREQWLAFSDMAKKYGDIVYLKVPGQEIIALNAVEVVSDLVEKRAAIYSDRPRMPMLVELMGWHFSVAFMNYGREWRKHRRGFEHHTDAAAVQGYQGHLAREVHEMLQRLLEDPKQFQEHARRYASATILRISYGIDIDRQNDENVEIAEAAAYGVSQAGIPGSFLVDFVPLLKFIPKWMPGAGFHKKAAEWGEAAQRLRTVPWNSAKRLAHNDKLLPSMATHFLEEISASEDPGEVEDLGRSIAATAYAAGADITASIIKRLFLVLALHPEIQAKAHQELDRIVGRHRLPSFEDKGRLPYLEALLKDLVRLFPAAPLGVPHCVRHEDEYQGYHIPERATIFINNWAILHDEKHYPEPMVFRPERYLKGGKIDSTVADPLQVIFGYGPRLCPGRHIANASLFVSAASILSCFVIEQATNETGEKIQINTSSDVGMISHPVPFQCAIRPRHDGIRGLITESLE